MPSIKLALEKQGPKRVEVAWESGWKNVVARLDGQEVGRIASQAELQAGREFPLPDGSPLRLQLQQAGNGPQLVVLRNGVPLPGSSSDPEVTLKTAAGGAYFIGGLNLVMGCLAAGGVAELNRLGISGFNAGYGLLFLVLAYFIGRRSAIALGFAVAIHAVDGILALAAPGGVGAGLFMRVFLLIMMWRGFAAIRELNAGSATTAGGGTMPTVPPAPQPVPSLGPALQPASAPQPSQPMPIPQAAAAESGPAETLVLRVSTGRTVPLKNSGWLFPSDLPGLQPASGPGVALVCQNPSDPAVYGLRNQSQSTWTAQMPSGSSLQIPPEKTVRLAPGVQIGFGLVRAEVATAPAAQVVDVNTVW